MPKNQLHSARRGLYAQQIDKTHQMHIDPDNAFWGIVKNETGSASFAPRDLLELYEKQKDFCDKEMFDFRFKTALTAVYVDPTDLCNAQCSYCYLPVKTRKHGQSISQEKLDALLKKIAAYFKKNKRTAVVIFHAAEPLIVKDILFKSIEKFRDELYFGIQTNSMLLKKEDVSFIKKNKVSIGISIDAADVRTNNSLRVSCGGNGGNFKSAVQALEWFRGYKGLNVITTVTKTNMKKLPVLVDFLHGKGVRCVLMNPMRLTRKGSRHLRPDDASMAKYFIKAVERSIELSQQSRHGIIIGNFTNILLAIVAPTARRMMCDISPCGGGRTFLTVRASGDMIPCGEFAGVKGNFVGGNIFKDSIEKALESDVFKQIRSRYVEKIPECFECVLRNICGAPCPAEMTSMGNLYKKSVFCDFYKEVIGYAFRLIAQGREKFVLRQDALKHLQYQYSME